MVTERTSSDLYNEDDGRCPDCFEWIGTCDHIIFKDYPEVEPDVQG